MWIIILKSVKAIVLGDGPSNQTWPTLVKRVGIHLNRRKPGWLKEARKDLNYLVGPKNIQIRISHLARKK